MTRLIEFLESFLSYTKKANVQRNSLVAATVLFVGSCYWALDTLEIDWANIAGPSLYILLFLLVPISMILNALEIKFSAHLIGQKMAFLKAIKVSVIASAANILPLPGGPLVRTGVLVAEGANIKRGFASVLVPALLWLGLSMIAAGTVALWFQVFLALFFLLVGLGAFASAIYIGGRLNNENALHGIWQLVWVKAISVAYEIAALKVAFDVIGVQVAWGPVILISASGAIAAASMLVPSGLGVREAVAAGLGVIVGVPVAASIMAAAIIRIISMAVLVPVALIFGYSIGKGGKSDETVS